MSTGSVFGGGKMTFDRRLVLVYPETACGDAFLPLRRDDQWIPKSSFIKSSIAAASLFCRYYYYNLAAPLPPRFLLIL